MLAVVEHHFERNLCHKSTHFEAKCRLCLANLSTVAVGFYGDVLIILNGDEERGEGLHTVELLCN